MLQWINDRMKIFGWLIVLPLAIVFVFWGIQGIVSFSTRQDNALQVNGEAVNLSQVREAYQRQLAQLNRLYPDEVPAAVRNETQQRIVDEFVTTALVQQKTRELRYVVSDELLGRSIKSYPGFQINGKFDRDSYEALLHQRGYTVERFEAEQRDLLKSRELEGGLFTSAFATPAEVQRAVALKDETRELAFAILPLAKFLPLAHADEAAIAAYYERHKAEYMTPETVHLSYVALRVADVAATVTVDDAALRAFYETMKERFAQPEKRRARHILLGAGPDDAAAKKKADEVFALAGKSGADFAALAKQYSTDAGSAANGGDLGWGEREFYVAPFAEALFSMQPGEIRGPVKTEFGWHVIKLEEIQPGASKSFEEIKAELGPQYRKAEAERRFGEQQEKIEQLAFEQSGSLEPVAKALGLKIEEIANFHKGLAGSELAANAKVLQAAFSADALGGQNSKAIELAPGSVVVLRASEHLLPQQQPLAAVRAEVAEAARREAASAAAQRAAQQVAAAVAAGTAWDAALRAVGTVVIETPGKTPPAEAITLAPAKFVGRREGIAAEIRSAAFAAPAPQAGVRSVGNVVLGNGNIAVWAVSAVKPGHVTGDGAAQSRELASNNADTDFSTYLAVLRARAKIQYSPSIFE
jgi:peptidyl-prolyl cis-trans isomerase D